MKIIGESGRSMVVRVIRVGMRMFTSLLVCHCFM